MNSSLTLHDFAALSPMLILLVGALILLLVESFFEAFSKKNAIYIALATLLIGLYASFVFPESTNPLLTSWLRFDSLAHYFSILFISIGIGASLLGSSFFSDKDNSEGEFYFLLLSAIIGLLLVASSEDFLTLFIGLETLSVASYVLCSYMKKWSIAHESAIKYFLTGSLGTALLLYGIALIYGAIGTTSFAHLLEGYKNIIGNAENALFLSGIALVTVGLAFKAAIVPFHVWAPDVYEGASNPVTAFMSVGTKAGAFAAFMLIFLIALPQFNPLWNHAAELLAYPTLIFANYVALRQTHLRRFFAYSGISHAGFMLIPLAAGTTDAIPALLFYLVVYTAATLGAFAVMAYLDKKEMGVTIKDLNGLFKTSPWLAVIMTLSLLTLAGIPPTAGFLAKFYIFKVAFQAGYYGLVIVGLLTTILSAYYYLRIISGMFVGSAETVPVKTYPAAVVGVLSLAAITLLSLYPDSILALIRH